MKRALKRRNTQELSNTQDDVAGCDIVPLGITRIFLSNKLSFAHMLNLRSFAKYLVSTLILVSKNTAVEYHHIFK